MKSNVRHQGTLWRTTIFLVLIGVLVVVRRTVHLVPILINGYQPPAATSSPVAAQFLALDDIFARYPVLTLIHILPALLFLVLGPLQFNQTCRQRHLRWHRWTGRVLFVCGVIVGLSALVMSFGMPAIGRCQSSSSDDTVCLFLFVCVGQSDSSHSAARNRAAPRMDDSCFLNWPGRRYYSAYRRRILRHQPLFRPDALRILWHRFLDWICAAPHRGGSLASVDSIAWRGLVRDRENL
jgi:Predicted membrane protein (DUF2306)